jgi:hypothetical protein
MHDSDVLEGATTEKSGNWLSRLFADIKGAFSTAQNRAELTNSLDAGIDNHTAMTLFFDAYIEAHDTSEGAIKNTIDMILRENPQLVENGFTTDQIYANAQGQLTEKMLADLEADRLDHHGQTADNAL